MSGYGKPKLALNRGDRVTVDLRNNDKWCAAEVSGDAPRIGVLCAGSVEWLILADGRARWVSETSIKVQP